MWRRALAVCAALSSASFSAPARAEVPDAADYGLADVAVSESERAADQPFGGWPNTKAFNNDTKCRAVTAFADAEIDAATPQKARALDIYIRTQLMTLDLAHVAAGQRDYLVRHVSADVWAGLPSTFALYCRQHPSVDLLHAADAVMLLAKNAFYKN